MLLDTRTKELTKFLKVLNLKSDDLCVIDRGLTHSSYIFENNLDASKSYERLEFLGDAVLKLAASKYLYEKFPDYDEGGLTKIRSIIVSDACLEKFAKKININKHLVLGNSETKTQNNIRASILACAFEGFIGALYESGDFNQIYSFLTELFESVVSEIDQNVSKYNAKAILQEYTQSRNKDLPEYVPVNETGAEHDKTFEVSVIYNGECLGKGSGKTKKEAQQNAATCACEALGLFK